MFALKENSQIIIWGMGYIGRSFYLMYKDKYQVVGIWDRDREGEKIENHIIASPDIENIDKNDEIIVVIAIEDYVALCVKCLELGLVVGKDFIPYDLVEYTEINLRKILTYTTGENFVQLFNLLARKKCSVVIGNCQVETIYEILNQSQMFVDNYLILHFPPIHLLTNKEIFILKKYIKPRLFTAMP